MVYKFNGECWYADRRSTWKRLRQWLIWIGGWEHAGRWTSPIRRSALTRIGGALNDATPVSVLGHWATFYGWGFEVSLPSGHLVVRFARGGEPLHAYISRDGTPDGATVWLAGAPREVVEYAMAAQRRREVRA